MSMLNAKDWRAYLDRNPDQLAADFEEAARLIREGDEEGLTRLATRDVVARAAEAAADVRKRPNR